MKNCVRTRMIPECTNGILNRKVRLDLVLLYMFVFYFVNRTVTLDMGERMIILYARISLVISVVIMALYIVKNRKLVSYDVLIGFGMLYMLNTIISTLMNGGNLHNAISAGYPYIAIPCFIGLAKKNIKELTVALAYLCYIMVIFNFFDAVLFKDLSLLWGRVVDSRLLLGGVNQLGIKFAFCTMMLLIYSKLVETRFSKFMLVTTVLMNLYLTYKVKSATTIISLAVFLILIIPPVQKIVLKINPKAIIIGYLVINLILFSSSFSFVKDFIQDVLKKDLTLSGRTPVWAEGIPMIKEKWLLGHGIGESGNVVMGLSMHNELLQRLFEGGILCVAPIWATFIKGFSNRIKNSYYGYFMAGAVAIMMVQLTEAPSSSSFFLVSILAYIYTNGGSAYDTQNNSLLLVR